MMRTIRSRGRCADLVGATMEDLSSTDAPPAGPPSEGLDAPEKPGPCRYYLVWGLLLTLGGSLLVWLGIHFYVRNMWTEGSGKLTVLVIGALVLLAGLTALLIAIYRAGAGIDYLVRQSR